MTGVVVVGTGFGCFTHVRALRAAGFDVLALVGRDPEKTAGEPPSSTSHAALTSRRRGARPRGSDAVTIATPPHTHAD